MKATTQTYANIARACVVSIGIVFLSWTDDSSAQENQRISDRPANDQRMMEDRTGSGQRMNQPVLQHRDPRYKLSPGDIFELTFPFTPDFNQTVTVHPDGFTTISGLGDLHVAGKTVPEIRELLKTAYARILHDPIINVVLKDFDRPYFIASGEIKRPGKYELRGDITLTQAIAMAGGFDESSKHSQVLLFRRVSTDWVEVKNLNVKKMFQAENLTEDVHLQPGDMLFVPQNRISKIRKWIPYTSISAGISPGF
jgi:polysaccharide export outer membrane protein